MIDIPDMPRQSMAPEAVLITPPAPQSIRNP